MCQLCPYSTIHTAHIYLYGRLYLYLYVLGRSTTPRSRPRPARVVKSTRSASSVLLVCYSCHHPVYRCSLLFAVNPPRRQELEAARGEPRRTPGRLGIQVISFHSPLLLFLLGAGPCSSGGRANVSRGAGKGRPWVPIEFGTGNVRSEPNLGNGRQTYKKACRPWPGLGREAVRRRRHFPPRVLFKSCHVMSMSMSMFTFSSVDTSQSKPAEALVVLVVLVLLCTHRINRVVYSVSGVVPPSYVATNSSAQTRKGPFAPAIQSNLLFLSGCTPYYITSPGCQRRAR